MTTKSVLVTGSGGCIGAWVIASLKNHNIPVVGFDKNHNRRRLTLLLENKSDEVPWVSGDINDMALLERTILKYNVDAIIHLAALQVPFCKQNPVDGATVNVVGTVTLLELARHHQIKRFVYASSVAATAMQNNTPWLPTLYGAYKLCNEQTAQVYWQDWQIPSIGIRPNVVYGIGRDQGMSALPSQAIVAACYNQPYTISFSGHVGFVYAQTAANAFIKAIEQPRQLSRVFELDGIRAHVQEFVDIIKTNIPQANIKITGDSLPFPAGGNDEALIECIGEFERPSLASGIEQTIERCRHLIKRQYVLTA